MKLLFAFITFSFLISACGQLKTDSYSKAMDDSTQREVLKYAILNDTNYIPLSTKAWTPEKKQIDSLELLLKRAIKENESDYNRHLKPDSLSNYYRQYTCYVKNGDSLISVNAFCSVPDNYDWQHERLLVADGGDCFWKCIINFSQKKILFFMINGSA